MLRVDCLLVLEETRVLVILIVFVTAHWIHSSQICRGRQLILFKKSCVICECAIVNFSQIYVGGLLELINLNLMLKRQPLHNLTVRPKHQRLIILLNLVVVHIL